MLAGSMCCVCAVNRELRMCVFEMRTVTRSKLFSFLACPHTTKFTLLSIFSPLEVSVQKIRETILSKHVKYSLPVAVHVSKTCVLKLPIKDLRQWISLPKSVNGS